MFGPIPMFDPLTGDNARPPMIGNSTANNIDGSESNENNDLNNNEQTFETMNRAAL
jgi:hypothetical protein